VFNVSTGAKLTTHAWQKINRKLKAQDSAFLSYPQLWIKKYNFSTR